jgi:hypothetical protein
MVIPRKTSSAVKRWPEGFAVIFSLLNIRI